MHVGGNYTQEDLKRIARRQHARLRKRFQAVIFAQQGLSAMDIANRLGCSHRAVQIWVGCYNRGGIEALTQWWKKSNGEPTADQVIGSTTES
jgi:transposase